MKEIQEKITTSIMRSYQEIVGEEPYEKWPGVFFPQLLAEYVQRSEDVLEVTFHIGVEKGKEETIPPIHKRLTAALTGISLDGDATLIPAGETIALHVAVNTAEKVFLQKPVHYRITKR